MCDYARVCVYTCMHVCTHLNVCAHRGQRTTWGRWFFPSAMWVLGTELRTLGFVAVAFSR